VSIAGRASPVPNEPGKCAFSELRVKRVLGSWAANKEKITLLGDAPVFSFGSHYSGSEKGDPANFARRGIFTQKKGTCT
jgi:hypothetical protein